MPDSRPDIQKPIYQGLLLFASLYFFTLPFPYRVLPSPDGEVAHFFGKLAGLWDHLFGTGLPYSTQLVSDSSGMYFHLLTLIGLSLAGMGLSHLLIRATWLDRRTVTNILYSLVLFFVVLHLFRYGFDKLFKQQFYFPEPNILFTPTGFLSKDILYWSTIGASHKYNVAMGLLEILPAVLLLFRRTRLLGALIATGVMAHIVVLNFSFDISVKVFSTMLLLAAGLLLAPWYALLARIFWGANHQTLPPQAPPGWEHLVSSPRLRRVLLTGIGILLFFETLFPFVQTGNFNADNAEKLYLHGAYRINTWIQNGDTLQHYKRLFVHKDYYLILQTTNDQFMDYPFQWDWGAREPYLDLGEYGKLEQYWNKPAEILHLEGSFLGFPTDITCTRITLDSLPLSKTPFRWTIDAFE